MKRHREKYCCIKSSNRVLKISMWKLIKTPLPLYCFPVRSWAIAYSLWRKWGKKPLFFIKYEKCRITKPQWETAWSETAKCCLPGSYQMFIIPACQQLILPLHRFPKVNSWSGCISKYQVKKCFVDLHKYLWVHPELMRITVDKQCCTLAM